MNEKKTNEWISLWFTQNTLFYYEMAAFYFLLKPCSIFQIRIPIENALYLFSGKFKRGFNAKGYLDKKTAEKPCWLQAL